MSRSKSTLQQKKTENQKYLAVFAKRAKESSVSYEEVSKKFKVNVARIEKM